MNSKKQVTRFRLLIALSTLFAVTGCGSQSSPPSSLSQSAGAPAGVEARIFVGNTNKTVSVINHGDAGNSISSSIDVGSNPGDMASSNKNHIFVNMGSTNQTAALDPVGETATFKKFIAVGQRPAHIYQEAPDGSRIWVMNDADPNTGIDTVTSACNTAQTASVSVIQNHGEGGEEESNPGEVLATICVGKGHHNTAFTYPTPTAPSVPLRAFISNQISGNISVIDNDPASANYLKVIGTIDLCDPSKESGGVCDADPSTSNESGPHGMYFSPVNGRIYNHNEEYKNVVVINPSVTDFSLAIEATLDTGFSGATRLSADGRFFFVRGTDTQSDATRVTGKLAIVNVADNSFTVVDLPDFSPSSLAFTADGRKLYIASGASGNTDQKASQKSNVVSVFDTTALPVLPLLKEITVGATTAGRSIGILEHDGEATHVFATNRADGTVSVIDAQTDAEIDKIQVGGTPTSLFVFPMEGALAH
ncbi:MAG: hypothetical protein MPW17_22625 (plasmid) [Candidatus Manganitrophus sp.]|nr:hypothetical protein [Candidatus Manganitrophus sp.]WDT73430.1 MAG: hypothetical protein MPW17_22625 [Candidatus Manganitrophus sp.]